MSMRPKKVKPVSFPPMPNVADSGAPGINVITSPAHYADCLIEPITFLLANNVSPCIFNVVKYCLRSPKHPDPLGSLLKAKQYLEWEIERLEYSRDGIPYYGPHKQMDHLITQAAHALETAEVKYIHLPFPDK